MPPAWHAAQLPSKMRSPTAALAAKAVPASPMTRAPATRAGAAAFMAVWATLAIGASKASKRAANARTWINIAMK